ncbi:hypothetical protein ACOME3_008588 [Neoechinorhynchus agilis]
MKRCPYPGGQFISGFCYYLSTSIQRLNSLSKKNASEQPCSLINGTAAAVMNYKDMIVLVDWIRKSTLQQSDDAYFVSSQTQGKFLMSLDLIDGINITNISLKKKSPSLGKLHWINGDEKIRVDKYDALKFVYSYDRGTRLLCPALDIPTDENEEPMFVTVNCANKQLPTICKTRQCNSF